MNWVDVQRRAKDTLSQKYIERLDALGFAWDVLMDAWEQGFHELRKFLEVEGHCKVKATYKTEGGFGLGRWVRTQRTTRETLSLERVERLDALGFVWNARKDKPS